MALPVIALSLGAVACGEEDVDNGGSGNGGNGGGTDTPTVVEKKVVKSVDLAYSYQVTSEMLQVADVTGFWKEPDGTIKSGDMTDKTMRKTITYSSFPASGEIWMNYAVKEPLPDQTSFDLWYNLSWLEYKVTYEDGTTKTFSNPSFSAGTMPIGRDRVAEYLERLNTRTKKFVITLSEDKSEVEIDYETDKTL